jgi:hypothetical protein
MMDGLTQHRGIGPVWTLILRRLSSRLAYWLSALGYNLRDKSTTNRIYLVYFCTFWLGWIVVVFVLFGSSLARMFLEIRAVSLQQAVVWFSQYALLVWALVQLWNVSRRSPFIFSEEDAYLLCQTPVSRMSVGIAWFIQNWMGTVLPFFAMTVVFTFALVEWQLHGVVTISNLPEYFLSSFRSLAIVIPLTTALQAGLWGIGALRLRGDVNLPWLKLAAPTIGVILLVSWSVPALHSVLMTPLSIPIQLAFAGNESGTSWAAGFILCLGYLAAGICSLVSFTRQMNLSQAARETRLHAAVQLARSYGMTGLADELLLRRRLGNGRTASRLPVRQGKWMLVWKDALQSWRSLRLSHVVPWLWVFGTSLGMFTSTDIALRLVMAGLWSIGVGGLAIQRLRNDLARWWLLRSLPLRAVDLIIAEIGPSCGFGVLGGWLALAFSRLPAAPALISAALLPFLVVSTSLSNVYDILRRSKARVLMSPSIAEENVPRQNVVGMLLGLISVLVPFGILVGSISQSAWLIGGLTALPVAMVITYLCWKAALSAYRWI